MGVARVLTAVLLIGVCGVNAGLHGCYSYHDHSAQYKLDPVAASYPWDEVKHMMNQNPQLSEVMAKGNVVPTSRPVGQQYRPVSVVCPSERIMVKAFNVDNKHCWVIKPDVQQLRYTRCSDKKNRDCHYCNYKAGGVSKCEEDYEWQTVWAYCKPVHTPHPYPHPLPSPGRLWVCPTLTPNLTLTLTPSPIPSPTTIVDTRASPPSCTPKPTTTRTPTNGGSEASRTASWSRSLSTSPTSAPARALSVEPAPCS